jgi:CBS domain-containing protein
VTPDTVVRIVSIVVDRDGDEIVDSGVTADRPEVEDESSAATIDADGVDEDEQGRQTIGLSIGNLPSALGPLHSVSPQSSIEEAITEMLLNDFSQLAVLSGARGLALAVSWKSIAQARNIKPDATLTDATFQAVEARYERATKRN